MATQRQLQGLIAVTQAIKTAAQRAAIAEQGRIDPTKPLPPVYATPSPETPAQQAFPPKSWPPPQGRAGVSALGLKPLWPDKEGGAGFFDR
jgi:hypothetical protein